jgi:hypothetical protein
MSGPDEADDDPLEKAMREVQAKRQSAIDAHEALRKSPGYETASRRTSKLIGDYGLALNAVALASTRWSGFENTRLGVRILDLLLESAVATMSAAHEGLFNAAHRELRFLLEASVKAWWSDAADDKGAVADKVSYLDDLGVMRFREIVEMLQPRMMDATLAARLMPAITNLYGQLSTRVHPSGAGVGGALNRFQKGGRIGFESIGDLVKMNALIEEVLDLSLASIFESFDESSTGDIFIQVLDDLPKWAFHKTPFVKGVSEHFDYKAERKERKGAPR